MKLIALWNNLLNGFESKIPVCCVLYYSFYIYPFRKFTGPDDMFLMLDRLDTEVYTDSEGKDCRMYKGYYRCPLCRKLDRVVGIKTTNKTRVT